MGMENKPVRLSIWNGGTRLGGYITGTPSADDVDVHVGNSGSSDYWLRFLAGNLDLAWQNTSSSTWTVTHIRVEVSTADFGSTWVQVGNVALGSNQSVPVNYTIIFDNVTFSFGDHRGLVETLMGTTGYSAAKDWRFIVRSGSGSSLATGTVTQSNQQLFTFINEGQFREAGPIDATNTSSGSWNAAQLLVEVKPVGSGTYGKVAVGTFSSVSIAQNQTLRMENISVTIS